MASPGGSDVELIQASAIVFAITWTNWWAVRVIDRSDLTSLGYYFIASLPIIGPMTVFLGFWLPNHLRGN